MTLPSTASTSHMKGFCPPLLQGSEIKDNDVSVDTSVTRLVEEVMGPHQCRRKRGGGMRRSMKKETSYKCQATAQHLKITRSVVVNSNI